ncbi:MAG: hypothetical protein MK008_03365 [Bdellovibrionales bacterium]|nr:hypothetical protein [Bdellovibrionales bacterium]
MSLFKYISIISLITSFTVASHSSDDFDALNSGRIGVTHFQSEDGEDLIGVALESYLGGHSLEDDEITGGLFPFKVEVVSRDGDVNLDHARIALGQIYADLTERVDLDVHYLEVDYKNKIVEDSEFKSTAFNIVRFVPIVNYRIGDTEVVLKASADLVVGYGRNKSHDRNTHRRRSHDDYRFSFSGRAGLVLYDAIEYEAYYSEESNISDGSAYTEMGNQIKLNFRNLDSRNLRQSSVGVGYMVIKNDIGKGPVFEERGIAFNIKLSWGGSRYSN